MKHVMQVFVICFLLIIPSNMILYTPAGSTDKNAFSNLNIIQNDSILRPIIRDEKLSFGDKLEFFIQPGRPPIPTYTATWTFPVGTIMNTIKIQANTLSLKQRKQSKTL